MSDSEGDDRPCRRSKSSKVNEFLKTCRRQGIPYPEFNDREKHHMEVCENCRLSWPHYYFEQVCELQNTMENAIKSWYELAENIRFKQLETYLKKQKKWISEWRGKILFNGYKLFISEYSKEHIDDLRNMSFGDRTKHISQKWKETVKEKKDEYTIKAKKQKACYMVEFEKLPTFKKKIYHIASKNKRLASNPNQYIKKPINAFFRFKAVFASDPKNRCFFPDGIRRKVNEESKEASKVWKIMTKEEKEPYESEYTKECKIYNDKMTKLENTPIKKRKISEDQTDIDSV